MNFLKLAEQEYGRGAYNYDKVVFVSRREPVIITCPEHGDFSMTPDAFIYTGGCRACRGIHPRGYPKRKKERKLYRRKGWLLVINLGDSVEVTAVERIPGGIATRHTPIEFHNIMTARYIVHGVEHYFGKKIALHLLEPLISFIEFFPKRRYL